MRESAGVLLYRNNAGILEFFLVHPGGPFWKDKDEGAWTIPKGELAEGETPFETALREFKEETGFDIEGPFIPLNSIQQKAGKIVHAWCTEENVDPATIKSNSFKIQWPPKSGKWISVPEIDKAGWFGEEEAKKKLNPAQSAFINDLKNKLGT